MMRRLHLQNGNIFAALFAGVALVGILGVSAISFMRGPLTGMTNLTRLNNAQAQMQTNAQISILTAASATSGGDCDSDTYVEPFGFKTTTGPKPTGGGLIPDEISAGKQDPWGSSYGYCAWNHGSDISNTCGTNGANRLAGTNSQAYTSLAIISAGPDKTFQTTCAAFVDATTPLVAKTPGSDDVIFDYTYANAVGASGGLWRLKSANPNVTELTSGTRTADVRMADQTVLGAGACTGVNDVGRVRYDSVSASLQVCNFVSSTYDWRAIGGGAPATTIDGLSDGITEYTTLFNVFLGDQSGASSTAGYNTAVGANVLRANTAGTRNIAIGSGQNTTTDPAAMRLNQSGNNNIAIGVGALSSNVLQSSSIAIGNNALLSTTVGGNVAVGSDALKACTTGASNTAVGYASMQAVTTGAQNAALGYRSLFSNLGGNNNVAIGYDALYSHTGGQNTAVGYNALRLSTGQNNVAIGSYALESATAATQNVAIGYRALRAATGSQNVAAGSDALLLNTSGMQNVAVGYQALSSNTTTSFSVGVGYQALKANTATGNVAAGAQALLQNTSGTQNTALGVSALQSNLTTMRNTAIGNDALKLNTSANNVAVGYAALDANTTGHQNVAFGGNALGANTTGYYNVAIGAEALLNNTTGSSNVAIGYQAGPTTAALTNTVAIGYGAQVTGSNKVRVGNTSITTIEGQVAWTAASDRRLKKDIKPSDLGLEFVMGLKPVSYRMKDGNDRLDYGFIAQDIAALMGDRDTNTVFRDTDKDQTYKLRHTDLLAPVVKAVQERQTKLEMLQKTAQDQQHKIEQLMAENNGTLPATIPLWMILLLGIIAGAAFAFFGVNPKAKVTA